MRALHHVGITVSDLERGIDFYHGVLGLAFRNEPSPVFDDPALGRPEIRRFEVRRFEVLGGNLGSRLDVVHRELDYRNRTLAERVRMIEQANPAVPARRYSQRATSSKPSRGRRGCSRLRSP